MRALFARDETGFEDCTSDWPQDLANRAQALSKPISQAVSPLQSSDQLAQIVAFGITVPTRVSP